jgi:sugar phosphate isomerase/epimerase
MYRNLSPRSLNITGRQSEIIELSLSYGFKGIDIDLADFEQSVKAQGLPHARRFLDSAKLKYGAFRLPIVWDEDDDTYKAGLPAMNDRVGLAAQLGLNRAVVTISPANDLRPYHENFEFHRRRLAELGEALATHGTKLGIEFRAAADLRRDRAFQFIHTFDALATLIGMIRQPNVGAVVDLFEVYVSGGNLDEVRKLAGDKIISVVVSDLPADKPAAEYSENDRLLLGETGTIDLTATLTMLGELGYDGPITPAVAAEHAAGMKREQIVKLAGERLKQAWDAAGLNPAGKLTPAGAKK